MKYSQQDSGNDSQVTLNCFSPAVMLFTFIFEFAGALFVLLTSKNSRSKFLIIGLLISLGIFQLAEYQVCGGVHNTTWMRIGYASISLLPTFGLHLISIVTKNKWLPAIGYVSAVFLVLYFLTVPVSINGAVCGGNYILTETSGVVATQFFPTYYFIFLGVALAEIAYYIYVSYFYRSINQSEREFLIWLFIGYAGFLMPTGAVYYVTPEARAAVPSIMCGFAVILAIILVARVHPIAKKLKI